MTLDYQLFLGFSPDSTYQAQLEQISPNLRSLFIQNHPDYLQQIEHLGLTYLGKYLGPSIELQSLHLIEANIYSLLQRLVALYPYKSHPLILLAVPKL